jgi:hypothetical protein
VPTNNDASRALCLPIGTRLGEERGLDRPPSICRHIEGVLEPGDAGDAGDDGDDGDAGDAGDAEDVGDAGDTEDAGDAATA